MEPLNRMLLDLPIHLFKVGVHVLLICTNYSKICPKQPLIKKIKIGFQDQLLLNAGQSIAESKRAFRNSFGIH